MEKPKSICDFIFGLLVIFLAIIIWIAERLWLFGKKLQLQRITGFKEHPEQLIFLNRKRKIFALKRGGKHGVSFSKGIVSFSYFGCVGNSDFHEFKISRKLEKALKEKLTPSALRFEEDMFRYQ